MKRIMKEFKQLSSKQTMGEYISSIKLATPNNVHKWNIYLKGPKGSPYEQGNFKVEIEFPREYPLKAPKVSFATFIFHPQINKDGAICLPMLESMHWNPGCKIEQIIYQLFILLKNPMPPSAGSGLNSKAVAIYNKSKEAFKKQAEQYTKKFASNK